MAIRDLSLKALREQIQAGTREVTFQTDDGSLTQMVYIPRFTVPAGIWENGVFPPTDLNLGGFFIDKYQCSHKAATSTSRGVGSGVTVPEGSTEHVAVSLPGRVPWTNIDWANAKRACANRKINGVSCHLVTAREWATMAFLIRLLGHDIRGNNSSGRDYRDPNQWAYFGVPDPVQSGRVLTGTGPVSWSHNGTALGVFDLAGNVREWVDFQMEGGIYTHIRTARVAEPLAAGASSVDVENVSEIEGWDAQAHTIVIDPDNAAETYPVVSITPLGGGRFDVRFAGSVSKSGGFPVGTVVRLEKRYCMIPGGSAAYLAEAIDDQVLTFTVRDRVDAPGSSGFAPGDTLQIHNEQVVVASVNGNQITVVARGANGSPAMSHPAGRPVAKLSPQAANNNPAVTGDYGADQSGMILSLRTEPDLAPLAWPKEVGTSAGEWMDRFWWRNYGARAALRGGHWGHGSYARAGFALYLSHPPSYAYANVGFRAALTL
ncbi:MAG: hypothetical protein BAA04_11380 [Firmicutes bacterium ZCTH02-B6]|nr:MAG: hypothetical protein BAA04_11380 [Firmicutes bacterium ZCTH02-B6]